MRIYNAITFLVLFIYMGIISFFLCLIGGTQKTLEFLKYNGVFLKNKDDGRK